VETAVSVDARRREGDMSKGRFGIDVSFLEGVDKQRDGYEYNTWERRWEKQEFLGTVFSLYPSGKFYTPWACSNVDACPRCQGKGTTKRHKANYALALVAGNARRELTEMAFTKYGAAPSWPKEVLTFAHALDKVRSDNEPTGTCSWCGGGGSREAYLDELFTEELEAALSTVGASLTSGEGDPCDLFAYWYMEVDEFGEAFGEWPDGEGADEEEEAVA
jgi:hypothetical protein